jgi:hypothetical protein
VVGCTMYGVGVLGVTDLLWGWCRKRGDSAEEDMIFVCPHLGASRHVKVDGAAIGWGSLLLPIRTRKLGRVGCA